MTGDIGGFGVGSNFAWDAWRDWLSFQLVRTRKFGGYRRLSGAVTGLHRWQRQRQVPVGRNPARAITGTDDWVLVQNQTKKTMCINNASKSLILLNDGFRLLQSSLSIAACRLCLQVYNG